MADYNSSYTGAQIDQRLGWAGAHAARHAVGGADALTPAAIGAMAANATPTPAAHAARHAAGGVDPIVFTWARTLAADGWSDGVQDLALPVTSANVVFLQGATDGDKEAFAAAEISVSHIAGGLRFAVASPPADDIGLQIAAV